MGIPGFYYKTWRLIFTAPKIVIVFGLDCQSHACDRFDNPKIVKSNGMPSGLK